MLNSGDIIFQLFALLIPVLAVFFLLFIIRSSRKRKEQLDRIEEKLERISSKK